jgi:hypothetical protein
MKTPNKSLLSIDTLVLAVASIWAVLVLFNLIT